MLKLVLDHQVHAPAWFVVLATVAFFAFEILRAYFAAHERDLYARMLGQSLAMNKTHAASIEVLNTAIGALAGAGGKH